MAQQISCKFSTNPLIYCCSFNIIISSDVLATDSALNSENPIPTYFFTYDSHNQFIFNKKEESLWRHFFDLVGNFKIDWGKSKEILKTVNEIKR